MNQSLVTLTSVTKRYDTEQSHAVIEHVSFEGCAGELVLILGPSGSGKTTLLLLAAGFLAPTSGTVTLFGKDIQEYPEVLLRRLRADSIGFVFQNHRLLQALPVETNVELAASFGRLPYADRTNAVDRALRQARIDHRRQRKVRDLSQGERQRVAIARSIVNEPSLLLADEPTASIESAQSLDLFAFYRSYARDHQACVVVATHDERLTSFSDRILRLRDGILIADDPDTTVTSSSPTKGRSTS